MDQAEKIVQKIIKNPNRKFWSIKHGRLFRYANSREKSAREFKTANFRQGKSCALFLSFFDSLILFSQFCNSLSNELSHRRTFLSFERKKSSGEKFAAKLRYHHQNLLIAKGLQIKFMTIFFLYPLQLQALAAFAGQARD